MSKPVPPSGADRLEKFLAARDAAREVALEAEWAADAPIADAPTDDDAPVDAPSAKPAAPLPPSEMRAPILEDAFAVAREAYLAADPKDRPAKRKALVDAAKALRAAYRLMIDAAEAQAAEVRALTKQVGTSFDEALTIVREATEAAKLREDEAELTARLAANAAEAARLKAELAKIEAAKRGE